MPQVMVLTPLEPFPHLRNDLMIPSFVKCEVGNFFTSGIYLWMIYTFDLFFFNPNSWLFLPFHSCPIHRLSGYPWVLWYFFCPGHQSPRRFPCLQFNCQSYNFLPLVSNAFRVNLFSALLACMTLVVLYLSAIEIIKICFPESSSELRIGPALLPPALPSGSNL